MRGQVEFRQGKPDEACVATRQNGGGSRESTNQRPFFFIFTIISSLEKRQK
jgi:hypothetical protein